MIPGQPASTLILIHPGCRFGILEGTFNKKTLPLHVGESFKRGLWRCIGKAILDVFLGIGLSPDHKMLLADRLLLVKPNPDSLNEYINHQPSLGRVANAYPLPGIFRLAGSPLFQDQPGALGFVQGRSSSFARLAIRDVWTRIFEIKRLIFVDIGNKLLALVIKGFEKEWFLAVPTVNTDPSISYAY